MTDNKKCVKRGRVLIIWDDPQRYEGMAGANRNKVGVPFQYAESPFAALTMIKSMTGCRTGTYKDRNLQSLVSARGTGTQHLGLSHSKLSARSTCFSRGRSITGITTRMFLHAFKLENHSKTGRSNDRIMGTYKHGASLWITGHGTSVR